MYTESPQRWGRVPPIQQKLLIQWLCASLLLALSTAIYGLSAGPALRALFGGDHLSWPKLLTPWLPPPPTLEELRFFLPLVLVGAAALKSGAFYTQRVCLELLRYQTRVTLRHAAIHKLWRLRPESIETLGEASLTHQLTQEIDLIEGWLERALAPLVRDGLQAFILIITAAVIQPELALLTVSIYPLLFWPIIKLNQRLRRAAKMNLEENVALHQLIYWSLREHRELLLERREAEVETTLTEQEALQHESRLRIAQSLGLSPALTELSVSLVLALSLGTISARVNTGSWAAEHVISFFVCVLLLYQPLKAISRALPDYLQGLQAWRKLRALLERPDEIKVSGVSYPLHQAPNIRFEELALERGDRLLFSQWDLKIPSGILCSIIGENGSGKSSLLELLARLREPTNGEIWIDDYPLSSLDAATLRESISWLTQRADHGEQLQSLSMNNPGDLLKGERTEGEHQLRALTGPELSQGERRRRRLQVLLKNPSRLLILDEPEAYLDTRSLERLTGRLLSLRGKHTIILFTHDPQLIASSDLRVRIPASDRIHQ